MVNRLCLALRCFGGTVSLRPAKSRLTEKLKDRTQRKRTLLPPTRLLRTDIEALAADQQDCRSKNYCLPNYHRTQRQQRVSPAKDWIKMVKNVPVVFKRSMTRKQNGKSHGVE